MATTRHLDIQYETPEPPLRLEKMFKFQQRLLADMGGALGALATYLGDRLGLFRALAEQGPLSAAEFARNEGACPEMTAEWLRVMVCAGYLEYEPKGELYTLPPEHAMILANDGGPMCFGGGVQQIGCFADRLPALLDALRNVGGVPQASYSQDLLEGMERLSASWLEHELVDHWIAALPDLSDRLRAGGMVADLGCGSGRALVQLAKAFPASRFVGYDVFPAALERAARNAAAAEVSDRVTFEVRDVTGGIPPEFDLVTAFDSLHDLPDPTAGLVEAARGLKKDGTLLVLELGASGDLIEEVGPTGVIHHATKLFYNLPVALASHGQVGGSTGFPEPYMKLLCSRVGLIFERSLPVRNPLHRLYVIKGRLF
jgi:ubiquinone/menaquinone biosynthesis C-methylase UbiE